VISDYVTGDPAPLVRDSKWTRALRAQALFKVGDQIKESPDVFFERFLNHGWEDDGKLKVRVKWFGFRENEATWQFSSSAPGETIRTFCWRNGAKLFALTREVFFFSDKAEEKPCDFKSRAKNRAQEERLSLLFPTGPETSRS